MKANNKKCDDTSILGITAVDHKEDDQHLKKVKFPQLRSRNRSKSLISEAENSHHGGSSDDESNISEKLHQMMTTLQISDLNDLNLSFTDSEVSNNISSNDGFR